MQPGKIVFIACVTSAITAAGTFFGLHLTVGKKARQQSISTAVAAPPPAPASAAAPAPSPPPVTVAPAPAADNTAGPKTAASDPGVRESKTAATELGKEVVVPRVTGVWLHAAQGRLAKAKLVHKVSYTYDEDRSEGLVLRQRPAAGTRVERGTTVRLTVNRDYD